MLTHVAFDFDGTLADSGRAVIELYNGIARESGYGLLTDANLHAMRALSLRERCAALGVPLVMLPVLMVRAGPRLREVMPRVNFMPGALGLVRELRAMGLRTAILSSNREENIRAFLDHHRASDAFDHVLCSHLLFGKHALLKNLMARERITADALAYVGDEERDLEACRRAKVRCLSVTWGFEDESRLVKAGAEILMRTPDEIAAWARAQRLARP